MPVDFCTLDFSLEYFVNRRCTPEWHLGELALESHNLMYLYAGRCNYVLQGRLYTLQSGDVIYTSQGSVRHADTPANCLMHCFAMNFRIRNADPALPVLPPCLRIGLDEPLLQLFRQLNLVWLEKRPDFPLAARGLLMLILSRILLLSHDQDRQIITDPRMEKIRRYIAGHLAEPLPVGQLAGQCGLNPVYFGYLFSQQTGRTVKAYINQLRIEKARALLLSGQTTVQETAEQCGFPDISYFSKVFRQATGQAPSRFARQSRAAELG